MSQTVTIEGLKYYIEQRNYIKTDAPIRTVNRGITGLSIIQTFDEAKSLSVKILTYREGYAPTVAFGDEATLLAAFNLMPVTIDDLHSDTDQWVWTSPLNYKWEYAISDITAPFIVSFTVDKYYPAGP